jgi:hypothetical protein
VRYVRMAGLCLVASVVLVACSAASASATLPEWGKCEATENGTGGKYADAACTQPVKQVSRSYPGGYEWYPLAETGELGYGQDSKLRYTDSAFESGILQPVSETTITFADGQKISCGPLRAETLIVLTGVHTTTIAPHLAFEGCVDDSGGGECHTLDARVSGEITVSTSAWENGVEKAEGEPGYGPSWNGTMTYIEGKQTSHPIVGIVYEVQENNQPFLQQLVCEESEIRGVKVGGHEAGEELTLSIGPLNTMSPSFTAGLRQSEGRQLPAAFEGHAAKPIEALVDTERWETVGFETTMLFPTELYVGPVNRNHQLEELELKATP